MNHLVVITAPPAAGKTYLISSLIEEMQESPLVLAPLRALVDECSHRWQERAIVRTPEAWLANPISRNLVIIDEFHLNFYWGDSFRPAMWEAFYGACSEADIVILLTATLNQEAQNYISSLSPITSVRWLNYGNQCLKNKPQNYLKFSSLKVLRDCILQLGKTSDGHLIFCHYRNEVLWWEEHLKLRGFTVWTCLGGEASSFAKKVQNEKPPQFIVATTVLSHGVNLPQIKHVYFTYPIRNIDFWIQMVARGGRRGEAFKVYGLEAPVGLQWSRMTNFLAIQWIELKMELQVLKEKLSTWFLKA